MTNRNFRASVCSHDLTFNASGCQDRDQPHRAFVFHGTKSTEKLGRGLGPLARDCTTSLCRHVQPRSSESFSAVPAKCHFC